MKTRTIANENIGSFARIVAALALLFFPLVASTAEDRRPAPPPAAPVARQHILDHLAASPLENSRQGLDEKNGLIPPVRFLIKPELHRGCNAPPAELASGSFEFGFQGREHDSESGLMHFRARSYDPMTGRFTSRDPVPASNLYLFCENDPVNKVDPMGEKWRWNRTTGWSWRDIGDGPTPTTSRPTFADYLGERDYGYLPAMEGVDITEGDADWFLAEVGLNQQGNAAEKVARVRRGLMYASPEFSALVALTYESLRVLNPAHFVAEKLAVVATGEEPVLGTSASRGQALQDLFVYLGTMKVFSSGSRLLGEIAVEGKLVIGPNELFRTPAAVVPRQGPKGLEAGHNANVQILDRSGNLRFHTRVESGGMTPEQQALGFPRSALATHTEAKAMQFDLLPGEVMILTGERFPCPSCKGVMNRAASETGAIIKYRWREGGQTKEWTASQVQGAK